MRILLVHGRAQGGKAPDHLKSIWVATMQEGFRAADRVWPDAVNVDFPYYADKLDAFAARANLPTPGDVLAKGPGQNAAFEQFMQSALDEIQRKHLADAEVKAHMDPRRSQEKGIQNWAWVQAIARAIDDRFTDTSSFTIEKFLRDVFLYLTNREVAKHIDAIVKERLTSEPTVAIGHSLGSVVAYNVLKKNRQTIELRKYISVGSPLGLRAISSKLGIPENIAGANGWYNAYDERDIVALNPLDDTYFPTEPAILNNNCVKNRTDNRHGIVGYLNDSAVAMQIAAALS